MEGTSIRPKQRIPFSKKNKEWKNNSYDYYSGACIPAIDRGEATQLYRIANGNLDESEYTFVTNPLNATKPNLMGYPARLANFDIITPNINTILGDWMARFVPPIVFVKNSNYENSQLEQLVTQARQLLHKRFINESIARGVPLEEEQVTQNFEDIKRKIKNLPNELGKNAQDALDYIIEYSDVIRKMKQSFYDYIVTARGFSWMGVNDDDVDYYSISPMNMYYLCSPLTDFVNSGDAIKCLYYMTHNEIWDRLQDIDEFRNNKELQEYLDTTTPATENIRADFFYATDAITMQKQMWKNVVGHYPNEYNRQGIPVEHLQWRSYKKVYVVSYVDIFGSKQTVEYDENYVPVKGEQYVIEWRDQLWEGFKIGDKYKIGIRPVPFQSPDDPKFDYNGRNAFTRYSDPQSLLKKGAAFQKKYNVVHYKLEESLLKNLDRLMVFPLSLIPDKEGWDENTTMYYARTLSMLFVNDTKSSFATAVNGLKSVDMSLNQYIMQMYNILDNIQAEWDKVCGISPQRKSDISNTAGKGTTDMAIQRSYIISEAMYTEFDEFAQKDYTGLIEKSKFAFANGKRATFIRRDGTMAHLNITNPEDYTSAQLGVFVKNTAKEAKRLDQLKANAQAFAQNQVRPSVIAKIIGSDNYQEIVSLLDDMEQDMVQKAMQSQQASQQAQQAESQAEQEMFVDELEYKYYKTDNDNLAKERVAIITSLKGNLDAIKPIMDDPNALQSKKEMMDLYNDRRAKIEDNFKQLKDLENREEELKLKAKEIQSKERMNKENNKVALKNKVSGEK